MSVRTLRILSSKPTGLRVLGMVLALLVAAFVLMAAACVPAAAAWADGGAIDLGLTVARGYDEPGAGASGSVDLGMSLKTAPASPESAGDGASGSVDVGIALAYAGYHEVSFVGYDATAGGSGVDATTRRAIGSPQKVAHGAHASAPDAERSGFWIDGWYTQDPAVVADAEPVRLSELSVEADTVLYCVWRTGLALHLDPNNGAVGDKAQGAVEREQVTVAQDATEGVSWDAFPEATRPGYVFAGWYWAKTGSDDEAETDAYGRAVLDREAGAVVPAEGDGAVSADVFREHAGDTLYADWKLAPCVKIGLTDALDADNDWGISMWYWPGRGYACVPPSLDMELAGEGGAADGGAAVYAEAGDELAELSDPAFSGAIAHNPAPGGARYFRGWGHQAQNPDTGKLEESFLIECEKAEGATGSGSGEGGAADGDGAARWSYRLSAAAFAEPFVRDGAWALPSQDLGEGGDRAGWKKVDLAVLSGTARISVSAPFEVTFQKQDGSGAVSAYSLDDLTWTAEDAAVGRSEWIQSEPFNFTNTGDTDVYVSGIECTDVGASAILPGGGAGEKIFSLYETPGRPEGDGARGKKAIPFGYAAAGSANSVTVSPLDEGAWIVLPQKEAGAAFSKQLYYGLHVSKAAFDRSAIAAGSAPAGSGGSGGAAGNSYVAKIANVKYTYSVAS